MRRFCEINCLLICASLLSSSVSGVGIQTSGIVRERVSLFLCGEGHTYDLASGLTLEIKVSPPLLYSPIGVERLPVTFGLKRYNATNCMETTVEVPESELQFTKFGHVAIKDGDESLSWEFPEDFCVVLSNNNISSGIKSIRKLDCNSRTDLPPTNGTSVINVKKCCPPGYVIDYGTRNFVTVIDPEVGSYVPICREASKDWKPSFYDPPSVNTKVCVSESREAFRYQFVSYGMYFDDAYSLARKTVEASGGFGYELRRRWRLLSNGSYVVFMPTLNRLSHWGEWTSLNVLCVDVLTNFSWSDVNEETEIVFALAESYSNEYNIPVTTESANIGNLTDQEQPLTFLQLNASLKATVFVWVLYVSTIPLILTMLAYALTWKEQNVYGWTVMSYLFTLTLTYVTFGTAQYVHQVIEFVWDIGWGWCATLAISEIYFFLSSFIWLTIMNFDLWWKFRKEMAVTRGSSRAVSRYLVYATLAFGVPLMVVLVGIVLDGLYGEIYGMDSDCDIFTPSFGVYKCFVSRNAEGFFMYYPTGILMILNIFFYILTIKNIYASRQSTRNILNRNHTVDLLALSIFTKLFFVTGVTFIIELVDWICLPMVQNKGQMGNLLFILSMLDIVGRSIGIFIVFAWRKEVMEEIQLKWNRVRRITGTKEEPRTNSSNVSGNGMNLSSSNPSSDQMSMAAAARDGSLVTKF